MELPPAEPWRQVLQAHVTLGHVPRAKNRRELHHASAVVMNDVGLKLKYEWHVVVLAQSYLHRYLVTGLAGGRLAIVAACLHIAAKMECGRDGRASIGQLACMVYSEIHRKALQARSQLWDALVEEIQEVEIRILVTLDFELDFTPPHPLAMRMLRDRCAEWEIDEAKEKKARKCAWLLCIESMVTLECVEHTAVITAAAVAELALEWASVTVPHPLAPYYVHDDDLCHVQVARQRLIHIDENYINFDRKVLM